MFWSADPYIWHKDTSLGDVDASSCRAGSVTATTCARAPSRVSRPAMKAVTAHAKEGGLVHRHLQRLSDSLRSASVAGRVDSQSRVEIHLRAHPRARRNDRFALYQRLRRVRSCASRSRTGRAAISPTICDRTTQTRRPHPPPLLHERRRRSPTRPTRTVRLKISPAFCNERRNVFGLMPHPERASELFLGSEDGKLILDLDSSNTRKRDEHEAVMRPLKTGCRWRKAVGGCRVAHG